MEDRVMRRSEVEAATGLTERQLRTLEGEDKFPKRFVIAPNGRAIGWSLVEIQQWIAERKRIREASHKPGMAKPGQRVGTATA